METPPFTWNPPLPLDERSRQILMAFPRFTEISELTPENSTSGRVNGFRGFRLEETPGDSGFFLGVTVPSERGGSFTLENLGLFHRLLDEAESAPETIPLILIFNSGGVRLTHERRIFNAIWGILPKLFRIRKQRLLITIADQQCLGAAALFLGQGNFRMATSSGTLINMTGPGIIRQFFGRRDTFHQYASAAHQIERHLLVQEIFSSLGGSCARAADLINFLGNESGRSWKVESIAPLYASGALQGEVPLLQNSEEELNFLRNFGSEFLEVFPLTAGSGKTYLVKKEGRTFGLLINPFRHFNNAIDAATVDRFRDALMLFRSLKIPLISAVDSAGGDPQRRNSDKGIIQKTLILVEELIDYPYPKLGLVCGRCFGGSGMLALPTVHGSLGMYAMKGAKIGVMADELISKFAAKSPNAMKEWEATRKAHRSDLSDLVNAGVVKSILDEKKLEAIVASLFKESTE